MPPDRDAPVTQALLRTFPGVSVVEVGDIVSQVGELLGQLSSAIVAAALVAFMAGIAVLIGAIAASRKARSYDSVILKTLRASGLQVLGAKVIEYRLLTLVLVLFSSVLGTVTAW